MPSSNLTEGSLSVAATFADPVFRLTQQSDDLQGELYKRLNPHGLRLDQIEENGAYTGPAGWSLTLRFLGFQAQLLVKVGGYELSWSNVRLDALDDALTELLATTEEAFHAAIEEHPFGQRAFTFFGYFNFPGGYETFVKRFEFDQGESLTAVELSGVSFAVSEPPQGMTNATVIIEKSVRGSDTIFLKAGCLIEASQHDLTESCQQFRSHVTNAIRISGLLEG